MGRDYTPATPNSANELEVGHNLSPAGATRLQAVIDRFNKETGGNLKLVRLEKGDKPAGLNLVRRQEMSEVLSQAKYFVPLHECLAKAGVKLDTSGLSGDLKANVRRCQGPPGCLAGALFDAGAVL
jgi:sn-glycerol 3-phosphate transport system substrate-binding protein